MNINKSFIWLLGLSLAGIFMVTGLAHTRVVEGEVHIILAFVFGIFPMSVFHYMLFKYDDLNQSQIDSIYFFGFLVTLLTLGCAATFAFIPSEKGRQIEIIVYQFALGLLATGYGLLARVLLTNRRITVTGPDDAIDQYLQKIGRVLERFEETVGLFDRLRDDVVSRARDGAEAISKETIKTLESEMRAPLESFRSTLNGITNELSSLQTSAVLTQINKELLKTFTGLQEFSNSLLPLSKSTESANYQMTASIEVHKKFTNTINTASSSIIAFNDSATILTTSANTVTKDFENISLSARQLINELSQLDTRDLSITLGSIAASFESLSSVLSSTNSSLTSLTNLVGNFGMTLNSVTSSFKNIVGDNGTGLSDQLKLINSDLNLFAIGFKGASADLDLLRLSFKNILTQTDEFSKVNILESLQKVIKEFSPLVTETQNSLLGIKNLVNTIDKTNEKLNPIVDSTINEIKILSEDLQSSAKALGAAMTLLAGSVRSAAEELSGK